MSVAQAETGASSSSSASARPPYLGALSEAQFKAVTAAPFEPLQILAGPGSGKTRVLVSRVAWLILEQNVNPRDLVVVTFTNKAANEMRHRLNTLIGRERTELLVMGTFHAMCAKYLRKYASLVGIGSNFTICDSDETKRLLKKISKDGNHEKIRVEVFYGEISRAKANQLDPQEYLASLNAKDANAKVRGRKPESTAVRRVVAEVYKRYEEHLRDHNALDFDDLLVYGVQLFANHARVIANLHHVLVDEFQDTNTIQYTLMSCLAGRGGSRGAVSIVGDPDQSIYGWRSADVGNLDKMMEEFGVWSADKTVRRVFLEENYRSTGHILQAAKGVIEYSSSRIERDLFTSHAKGPPVSLQICISGKSEASFIVTEIKRLMAHSGGLFTYDDFAILLRFNALSREVEQQLLFEDIPSRMMGGARFFERKEVKDILAYLSLADNSSFSLALERIINVPKRSIGEKTVENLHTCAKDEGIPTMEFIELVANSKRTVKGLGAVQKKKLKDFADVIASIRKMASERVPMQDIIQSLLKQIDFEAYLRKEPDFEQRWENVKELINFSTVISWEAEKLSQGVAIEDGTLSLLEKIRGDSSPVTAKTTIKRSDDQSSSSLLDKRGSSSQDAIDLDDEDDDVKTTQPENSPAQAKHTRRVKEQSSVLTKLEEMPAPKAAIATNKRMDEAEAGEEVEKEEEKQPLRVFLEACTLSTDMNEKEDEKTKKPKVTIATAHAAKGLEFPVVFVISVEDETYPFYRARDSTEEVDEEARLLYVAITRAQALAYLTYCSARIVNGQEREKTLSPFVKRVADASQFAHAQWKPQTGSVQAGGFMHGGFVTHESYTRPPPRSKVEFGLGRPNVTFTDWKLFATILSRRAPTEQAVDSMAHEFESSGACQRAKRVETECKRLSNRLVKAQSVTAGYSGARPIQKEGFGSGMSLFSDRETSPSLDAPERLSGPTGIRPASSLISSINRNSGSSIFGSLGSTSSFGAGFGSSGGSGFGGKSSGPLLSNSSNFGQRPTGFSSGGSMGRGFGSSSAGFSNPLMSSSSNVMNNLFTTLAGERSAGAKRLGAGRGPMLYPKKAKTDPKKE